MENNKRQQAEIQERASSTFNEKLQSTNAEMQTINEQLLNRANAYLESILASVDVAVVVKTRDFEISLWNERTEDLWGSRKDEAVGQSLLNLGIELPVEHLKEPVESVLAGEAEDEKLELEAVNRRGKPIRCYVTRTIRLDEEGDPEGVVLLMEEARE